MAATQPSQPDKPESPDKSDRATAVESIAGQVPPIPDEAGPHDVPDDKVIEKTLPSVPVRDPGSKER